MEQTEKLPERHIDALIKAYKILDEVTDDLDPFSSKDAPLYTAWRNLRSEITAQLGLDEATVIADIINNYRPEGILTSEQREKIESELSKLARNHIIDTGKVQYPMLVSDVNKLLIDADSSQHVFLKGYSLVTDVSESLEGVNTAEIVVELYKNGQRETITGRYTDIDLTDEEKQAILESKDATILALQRSTGKSLKRLNSFIKKAYSEAVR